MTQLVNDAFKANSQNINNSLEEFIEKLSQYVIFGHPNLKGLPTDLKEEYRNLTAYEKRSLFYTLFDEFTTAISIESICTHKDLQNNKCFGCNVSVCCQLDPDVFDIEKNILDGLVKSNTFDSDYCSFFDKENKMCTIYEERPFSCRSFFNFTNNKEYCIDADKTMNDLKLPIFMYAKLFLGNLAGPYHSL